MRRGGADHRSVWSATLRRLRQVWPAPPAGSVRFHADVGDAGGPAGSTARSAVLVAAMLLCGAGDRLLSPVSVGQSGLRRLAVHYHQDRIHDSLEKDTPNRRPVEHSPSPNAGVL